MTPLEKSVVAAAVKWRRGPNDGWYRGSKLEVVAKAVDRLLSHRSKQKKARRK